MSALIEEVRFAPDSPVEEEGFEPPVPLTKRVGLSGGTGSAAEAKRAVWKSSSILRETEGSNLLPSCNESLKKQLSHSGANVVLDAIFDGLHGTLPGSGVSQGRAMLLGEMPSLGNPRGRTPSYRRSPTSPSLFAKLTITLGQEEGRRYRNTSIRRGRRNR